MLYAELGRHPLEIIVKKRIIGFWNKLLMGKDMKISYLLYHSMKSNTNPSIKWISNVIKILSDVEIRYDLWVYQRHINTLSLGLIIQQSLHDQGSLTLAMGKCLWFFVKIKVCQSSLSSP